MNDALHTLGVTLFVFAIVWAIAILTLLTLWVFNVDVLGNDCSYSQAVGRTCY
jgi:hypothetical protein